ncbi:hypothetical protein [Acidovorax sp.]|uniref:hypothetical protein n=1 Tax=Acidovorax sp. TaxID=1872122 RepID=UPI002ACD8EC6|nr:hypothetical protein [Acidovorax sp.]MDZ7861217.1 hypothetical protein [Acidovorax sp.]
MRTELSNRMIGSGANALASSIVLVCRQRDASAETISRREFQRQLREHLPEALETMIGGTSGQSPIAPVDLAQAAIGPGMAIYSQYAGVLNQDGTPMRVHDALVLINREITEYLTPDAGSFDADTLFANGWFEQYGWAEGPFGEANVLAQAKGTSVAGVTQTGVVQSGAGKVRLLRWTEYEAGWDPRGDDPCPGVGGHAPLDPRPEHPGRKRCRRPAGRHARQGEPSRCANWHTTCIPCASARSGRRKRGRTTS